MEKKRPVGRPKSTERRVSITFMAEEKEVRKVKDRKALNKWLENCLNAYNKTNAS